MRQQPQPHHQQQPPHPQQPGGGSPGPDRLGPPRRRRSAPSFPGLPRSPSPCGQRTYDRLCAMTPTTETMVGIGGAAESTDMVLNIGPQHPSTHGVLRLRLVLDGERISTPSRSSATCTAARRSCSRRATTARSSCSPTATTGSPPSPTSWASSSPSSGCSAWRSPSARCGLRTLLAELNRVLNHLMFLGSYPLELGGITPIFYAFTRARGAPARDGGGLRRAHALHVQPGRRPQGGPAGRLDRARACRRRRRALAAWTVFDDLVLGNEIFRGRTRGVGVARRRRPCTRTA